MRCRLILAVSVSIALFATVAPLAPPTEAAARPRHVPSPPGQVLVVSANAWQFRPLGGRWTFERLLGLALAVSRRPPAFNGGFGGAVTRPDVITVQEIRLGNAEILVRLLRSELNAQYELVESLDPWSRPLNPRSKIIYDADMVELVEAHEWADACFNGLPPHEDHPERIYQWARFVDKATGAPFVVAGVHFDARYPDPTCRMRNVDMLRLQLEAEPAPVVVGGDFNARPVEVPRECDPDERSEPLRWWSRLTSPGELERPYVDTVRFHHRRARQTMAHEWTFETKRRFELCDGTTNFRRGRIDYLFAEGADGGYKHMSVKPERMGTGEYEEWAESTIRALLEAVRREDFAPNPEADCMWCRFKPICPVWPQGAEVTP
jgi:hypothetical protein